MAKFDDYYFSESYMNFINSIVIASKAINESMLIAINNFNAILKGIDYDSIMSFSSAVTAMAENLIQTMKVASISLDEFNIPVKSIVEIINEYDEGEDINFDTISSNLKTLEEDIPVIKTEEKRSSISLSDALTILGMILTILLHIQAMQPDPQLETIIQQQEKIIEQLSEENNNTNFSNDY